MRRPCDVNREGGIFFTAQGQNGVMICDVHSYKADIYVDSEFIISVPLYSGVVNEYTYFKVENGKALPLFE